MLIGVPKEIKNHEYRVGLTPESVAELVHDGQSVIVETQAGSGIGASDEAYKEAGAEIVSTAAEIFERAEMIIKVKEPQAVERAMLREGQILYTYLHLAPDPEQTKDLIASNAYEPSCRASGYPSRRNSSTEKWRRTRRSSWRCTGCCSGQSSRDWRR